VGYTGVAPTGDTTPGVAGGAYIYTTVTASFAMDLPDSLKDYTGNFYFAVGAVLSINGFPPYPFCVDINCPDPGTYPVGSPPTPCTCVQDSVSTGISANSITLGFGGNSYYVGFTYIGFDAQPSGFGQSRLQSAFGALSYGNSCSGSIPIQDGPFIKLDPTFYLLPSYTPYTAKPSDFENFTVTMVFTGAAAVEFGYYKSGIPEGQTQQWGDTTFNLFGVPFTLSEIGVALYWPAGAIVVAPPRQPNVCINT
jgi:hypothetical protein